MDMTDGNVPVTVCKLATLSLMEVFKDVLPDYRIRLFTSKEKHQKVCNCPSAFCKINICRNIVRLIILMMCLYLQCFDAVGWAAGRASGL